MASPRGDRGGCHIEPDWLLIRDEAEQMLTLVRKATHADLFE
jgi:mRNA-degrading endonuclease YafQ of YafQ-DinJ toxin-antitoxin module